MSTQSTPPTPESELVARLDFSDLEATPQRNPQWLPTLQDLVYDAISWSREDYPDADEDAGQQFVERLLIALREAAATIERLDSELRLCRAALLAERMCADILEDGAEERPHSAHETLFDAIQHGDEVHRAWLREAIENHFSGKPVPPPRAANPSAHEQGRREEWRCFHCDDVFTDRAEAAAHFGWSEHSDVACRLNECEGGVVALLRQAHAELSAYRDDDTKLIREVHGLGSKHQTEKREQEELGYSRGLADGRALSSAPPGEKGK